MKLAVLILATTIAATSANADGHMREWKPSSSLNSADLANWGWINTSAAGLSWPDGRQSIITFWEDRNFKPVSIPRIMRCVDHFDKSLQSTGGKCYYATDKNRKCAPDKNMTDEGICWKIIEE